MPVWELDDALWFPPPSQSEPDGLLAIAGDLNPDRLLLAYRSGIFPWFSEGDPLLWWSPDPRFVLYPEKLKISKSMKQVLKSNKFEFRTNTAFGLVMKSCSSVLRPGQDGTWITEEMIEAYCKLNSMGIAQSAEAWQHNLLVGGLYGVRIGKMFFGESMFSLVSNASKFAFISLVKMLEEEGVKMIDCQMHTPHLESLGAESISRAEFLSCLSDYID